MRMARKKPTVQTPATGSTTVVSMPETKVRHRYDLVASTSNTVRKQATGKPGNNTSGHIRTGRVKNNMEQGLTGFGSVWHFDPDRPI